MFYLILSCIGFLFFTLTYSVVDPTVLSLFLWKLNICLWFYNIIVWCLLLTDDSLYLKCVSEYGKEAVDIVWKR